MDGNNSTKRLHWFLRLLAFLMTVALVAGAISLVVHHDRINLDSLKRWFTYRSLSRSDSGVAESFSYSRSSTDVFAALGSDLLVCSESGVRLYSSGGVCYVDDTLTLPDPVVEVCGSSAAVYSAGGSAVYLYRSRAQYASLTGLEGALISVRLNSSGWLAVTTRESGYKAVITVYDQNLVKLMSFRLSSTFAADAVVTENCQSLAVITIGLDNAAFESTLSLYALPTSQSSGVDYDLAPVETLSLGNNVILDLEGGNPLWCVGDAGVSIWDGTQVYTWSCEDKHLKSYAISSSFTAILIGKYRAGSQAELCTVDNHGVPSSILNINEQVLSLSAAGKYVAVLTADRLDIYTQNLNLYASLDGTNGAKQVLMRSDGSALLIGNESAHLYIPN